MTPQSQVYISQRDNYAGKFGFVYRSSAIFYYKLTQEEKTTISFMDYWGPKRSLEVYVIALLRDMDGNLIRREELLFMRGQVLNYRPEVPTVPFEGSVEIEVFCAKNMVIPYAAIMAVYERPGSVSMVHSYSRVYSPHEVEEARTTARGEESCWTIRDSSLVKGFAVFHNGNVRQDPQQMKLEIINSQNDRLQHQIDFPSMGPYETVKIYPSDYVPELVDFLGGEPGNASLSFQVGNAFTRMLLGNETIDGREMQVTHSNFNYSQHIMDTVANSDQAYMLIPQIPSADLRVVVYPDCTRGQYSIKHLEMETAFSDGIRLEFPVNPGIVEFGANGGQMPTRIVTGLIGSVENTDNVLPFESSLGVEHADIPAKHSHWGLVSANSKLRSRLYIMDSSHGGETMRERRFDISLYSSTYHTPLSKELSAQELEDLRSGILYMSELFPEAESFLDDDFGYFFLTSEYGWARVSTTLESPARCMTYEHSF